MWRDELVKSREEQGVGLQGLPGTDEEGKSQIKCYSN